MSGVGRTATVSTHKYRRVARTVERILQRRLDNGRRFDRWPWARGARVESAGEKQFAVVLTEDRGR